MKDRPLDSDTLGELGEKQFGGLCARADLIANVASRDRAGWDYTVDFRLANGLKGLDARPAPISVRVQVKTQWDDSDVVKLRLSSAEQLVKHNGPSFICVLSVDSALQFVRMRMIHCRGEILGRVLKRLREAEVRGEKPNQVWLTIKPSEYVDAVTPDHNTLRSVLEAACPTDQMAYLNAKDAELKTLGFEQGSTEFKVTFSATEDEIVDAFLGLRPIEASTVTASETRFGIALPKSDLPEGPATLRFEPYVDRCDLVFRTTDKTYRFRGRAFRPPGKVNAAAARPKILIRTDLLRITLISEERAHGKKLNVNIGIDPDLPDDVKRKPSEWSDAYAVLAAITTGGVGMEVLYGKRRAVSVSLSDDTATSGSQWRKLMRLTAAAALVFERAGAPNAKVSLQGLWDAGDEISTMAAIIRAPESVTGVSFATETVIALPRPGPITMMLGHAFKVEDHMLAYGAEVIVTGTERETDVMWSSDGLTLLGLQRVRSEHGFERLLQSLSQQPYRVITGSYQTDRSSSLGRIEAAVPVALTD